MRSKLHILIKSALFIFLITYLVILYSSNSAKNTPMTDIAASYETQNTLSNLQKRSRVDLKRFYQIDDSSSDGYFFYKASSPMSVDEVMIIKANTSQDAKQFLSNAENHLASQKRTFEGYGTDQMALLNNAIVGSRGKFVFYFCGSDASSWYQTFTNLI